MTDTPTPDPQPALVAARRALHRFYRRGPTHGSLEHEIAKEIIGFAAQHSTAAQVSGDAQKIAEHILRDKQWPNGCPVSTDDAARLITAALTAERAEGRRAERERLGFGQIVMMSEQRNKPGLPSRWCALARGSKVAAYADSEEEARIAALAEAPPGEGLVSSDRVRGD